MTLEHLNPRDSAPERAVVIGAGGFIGGALARKLRADNVETLTLGRSDVDLLAEDAAQRLAAILRPSDTVVMISAEAPCKSNDMLARNVRMLLPVAHFLETAGAAQAVYVSSDAVYSDSMSPIAEDAPCQPDNPHGMMHVVREAMMRFACQATDTPLAILRPTLVYGADDPHNGYGPNRFRRQALAGEDIPLFGAGEEQRDHIWVEDVAELTRRTLFRRSRGVLTLATGQVVSFMDLARAAAEATGVSIETSERRGPMPHNGYRAFDVSGIQTAFPDFTLTQAIDGTLDVLRTVRSA